MRLDRGGCRTLRMGATVTKRNSRILCVSDLHTPFEHPDTVAFLRAVKAKYKPTRVVLLGDECFPESAEILTETGWRTFREVVDTKAFRVAQWHEDGSLDFVMPYAYIDKPFSGELRRIEHATYLSLTTPKHAIVKLHPVTGKAHRREAWDTAGTNSWEIPRAGRASGPGVALPDAALQLQVAFQADGTDDRGAAKFEFSKARKIQRLRGILQTLALEFTETETVRGTTILRVLKDSTPAYLSKLFDLTWISQLSADQRVLVLRELEHWDGTATSVGVRYSSAIKHNLDFVQALAASSGLAVSACQPNYVTVHYERQEGTSQKSAEHTDVPYSGQVCCVSVPTGMILVRQEGHVTVSGNCDAHAMSFHDSDPDLPSAGDELKAAIRHLKPLYKLFPEADIIDSNHGSMVYRKGKHHGIPRKYLRDYNDILEAPAGWRWSPELILKVPGGNQVYFHHGLSKDVMKVVQLRGMCVVQGHYHTEFKVGYIGNPNHLLWGLQIGCSIDSKALAFEYDKTNLGRPVIGHAIILNGIPHLLPMILNKRHRWVGVVP